MMMMTIDDGCNDEDWWWLLDVMIRMVMIDAVMIMMTEDGCNDVWDGTSGSLDDGYTGSEELKINIMKKDGTWWWFVADHG